MDKIYYLLHPLSPGLNWTNPPVRAKGFQLSDLETSLDIFEAEHWTFPNVTRGPMGAMAVSCFTPPNDFIIRALILRVSVAVGHWHHCGRWCRTIFEGRWCRVGWVTGRIWLCKYTHGCIYLVDLLYLVPLIALVSILGAPQLGVTLAGDKSGEKGGVYFPSNMSCFYPMGV